MTGFFKISSCVPVVRIGDVNFNVDQIIDTVSQALLKETDCMVFPELGVTGYTCGDLFQQELLMKEAEKGVERILKSNLSKNVILAIGCPVPAFGKRYNCAIVINSDKILGIVPKIHIPNYSEFYEKRWFETGYDILSETIEFAGQTVNFGTNLIFRHKGIKIGIEICEDLWVPQPPSGSLTQAGAEVILNLSASDELIGKNDYIKSLISQQSARCRCVYAYSSAGWGESSTDLVFSGKALIGYEGSVYGEEKRFSTGAISETFVADIDKLRLDRMRFNTFFDSFYKDSDYKIIESKGDVNTASFSLPIEIKPTPLPFVPTETDKLNERCEEILNIQAYGLMKRLDAIGCKRVVIGISGGLDSTLAVIVAVKAFDNLGFSRKGIIAVTMPGLATTSRTKSNSLALMDTLGVTGTEIPIKEAVDIHFRDINQDPTNFDATYENSQARERTQILMDLANKENGIVLGTGDMSELALGWCTYNGDHMSMYGVNASVPKTLVKHLVKWYASKSDDKTSSILEDIIDTPISPELVPSNNDDIAQKTEDLVGPYELHDFFLYHFLRNSFTPVKIYLLSCRAFEDKYAKSVILKWLKVFIRRFFSQQFKRSCMPDGPKVGNVNLSPRGDWRMPSDASSKLWLAQLEEIKSDDD